ncbi:MAG TPA: helix-turn-helix domain-containing protein [Actinoplanes sp.]|nr:helix-turn-helix domain-containing protein [Actinoplanes sp.]
MGGAGTPPTAYYRPAEVAKLLRCSEWWIKEQARRRRIPYAWIGGSYLFTADHVTEIVRLFEVQPGVEAPPAPRRARADRQSSDGCSDAAPNRLRARPPRRARLADKSVA